MQRKELRGPASETRDEIAEQIESLLESFSGIADASADVAAVGPRILDADGSVYPSARRLPSLSTGIGHTLLGGIASPVGVVSLVLLAGFFFGAGTARAIARAV